MILQPCFQSSASTKQKRVYFSLCYNSQVQLKHLHIPPPEGSLLSFFLFYPFFPQIRGKTRLYQRRNHWGVNRELGVCRFNLWEHILGGKTFASFRHYKIYFFLFSFSLLIFFYSARWLSCAPVLMGKSQHQKKERTGRIWAGRAESNAFYSHPLNHLVAPDFCRREWRVLIHRRAAEFIYKDVVSVGKIAIASAV